MSEFRLEPTSALGPGNGSPEAIGGHDIRENTGFALASLSARSHGEAETLRFLAELTGMEPPAPGTFSSGNGYTAFWMSPGSWMLAADHAHHELLAGELSDALKGVASVSEQNDAWICLDVTGPDLPAMFERLMAADTAVLKNGSAVRTVIEHIGCFVLCLQTGRHYRIFAGRSFGRSLNHALWTGARATHALAKLKVEAPAS